MAIADLLAQQRPPNYLQQGLSGYMAGQQIGQNRLQQQQQQQELAKQGRLSGLLQQGAQPEQLIQGGFVDTAQKIIDARSKSSKADRDELDFVSLIEAYLVVQFFVKHLYILLNHAL